MTHTADDLPPLPDSPPAPDADAYLAAAERAAATLTGAAAGAAPRPVRRVGIVGAGTMGSGIAVNFLAAGIPVQLVDVNEAALARGRQAIAAALEAGTRKGRWSAEQAVQHLAGLSTATDLATLADRPLVIEAVFENLDLKRDVMARLGALCRPGAILATNTSTLNVDTLAAASGRPADVLGTHFFSPAHVMRLLEVVRGAATAPDVLATAVALGQRIGKVPVVSGVCYGFIGNRMLEGYLRETDRLLLEGATPAQIDAALEAFGLAMGPCRMLDMSGVDVSAKVVDEAQARGDVPRDAAYRVVTRHLHALGRDGQKTGAGYYRHEGRTPVPDPQVTALCAQWGAALGVAPRAAIGEAEIVQRCLLPLINEGFRILDEGIAARAGDLDVVWCTGYGFPRRRGGPMRLAATWGLPQVVARLRAFAARYPAEPGWQVAPLLQRLSDQAPAWHPHDPISR